MSNHNNQYSTPPSGSSQATAVSSSVMMAMMRNNPASAGGTAGSSAAAAAAAKSNGAASAHFLNQLETRMGQILDDADHKRCSEGNQRALLAEKLENLRHLTKELEKDEWKYAPKPINSGMTLSNFRPTSTSPF